MAEVMAAGARPSFAALANGLRAGGGGDGTHGRRHPKVAALSLLAGALARCGA